MEKTFLVTAEAGIHARPATTLVNEAVKFESNITLKLEDKVINLKSIMGVMSLGINNGSIITIDATGNDEQKAILALTNKIYELKLGKEY